jgi:hypothetical protein
LADKKKHEEYFVSILAIKTGLSANKIPTPVYKFIYSNHDVSRAFFYTNHVTVFRFEITRNFTELLTHVETELLQTALTSCPAVC